ncbi:hypothetical protein MNQ96_16615 [Sphingopyxis granuli]|uniref:hypothetical protein n=1 Tax=Sphingopyxis granuli TaxID=267128 RepID=UPI001F53987C|nr:hypothetical protein [Sphingopyxis granuli]UNK79145.1 hypothetical protein MNQ96_16615 [Sphingopyxis granuli]
MSRAALLLLACGAALSAAAAPPPPPVYPDDLPRTLDGYALGVLYSRYSFWIEAQKGAVIDAIMDEPADVAGYRPQFAPPVGFKTYSDYGHVQSGDIRGYCRTVSEIRVDRGDCRFVFRSVMIPAAAIDRTGPVGIFMRETFDPAAVVASLKANGVAPDADMWRVDGHRIFGTLPSPAKLLRDNAKVETVDSQQCPAMRHALEAIEGQALPQRIDIPLIGEDGPISAPHPHAAQREERLAFVADGGSMTVTSWRGLEPLLGPVYAAVDACLRDRLPAAR